MKAVFFNAYYYPEKAASSYLFDNIRAGLAENGHEVVIYTPTPTRGVTDAIRNEYKKKKHESLFGGRIKVHRFPLFREGKNPAIRAFRYFCCVTMHIYFGLRQQDADVMYVSSTPPIAGAMLSVVRKIKKVPVIYFLQDIFPDSLVSTGLSREGSLLFKIGRMLESYTYRHVDKIVVISRDCLENILKKGVPEEKVELIYNWVDESAVKPVKKEENRLFDDISLKRDGFYITYAGNLGRAQDIDVILEAAKLLKDQKEIKLVIFGGGALEENYKQKASRECPDNVLFFPMQPYSRVSEVYSLGDASLITCKEGLGKSAMPSKTWSIMAAQTPVIACFDEGTDMQRIIEKENVGLFVHAGDAQGLKNAILTFYNDKKMCQNMGAKAREYVMENFTRSLGVRKYINLLDNLKKR